MTQTVLIVDDDPVQRRLLETAISRMGLETLTAPGGGPALDLLFSPKGEQVSLVLLDLVMPDIDGIQVLTKLRAVNQNVAVIVLTAKGGIDSAVEAMRAGASDFLIKPASPERIKVSIQNALKLGVLTGEVSRLKKKQQNRLVFDDLIARSAGMRQVIRLGTRAAQSTIPILIEGESGVGKELIARAIQGCSERAGKPFVTLNCGAIPDNLIESILFGHEKGSFTGATDKHLGKFLEADGGTLFLDEIGELKLDMQVKLLRALQEGEIDPVGAKRPVKVDVRIMSATNRDLAELTREGRFREDLYYRLNVFPVFIPPLRERPRRRAGARPIFRRPLRRGREQAGRGLHARGAGTAQFLFLARQCAPAREHDFPRRRAVRRGHARIGGFPADRSCDGHHAARACFRAGSNLDGRCRPRRSQRRAGAAARANPLRSARWMRPAICASSKSWKPKSSAWRSRAMTGACRKWRAGSASAVRRSTASSRIWVLRMRRQRLTR